jgi:V/A-type H+-transporting ATPase subunit I
MLRPEDMTRAVVVGSRDSLDVAIDCLYELGVLHLIDFTEPDEEFKLGEPLGKASTASQRLLKLRSMARSLEIESHKPSRALPVREIEKTVEQALVTLDLNTSGKAEAKQKISSLIREKDAEIRALEPFRSFPVPVEDYEGYESIAVFAGICKQDPGPALAKTLTAYELFGGEGISDFPVALFVADDERVEASRILANHGFQEVKLPKLSGHPRALIDKLRAEIEDLEADLARIEDELGKIRNQFADFVVASEEHLSIEVLKAETPLRIATSENSFVIDGWMPTSKVDEIRVALDKLCCGLAFVETIPVEKGDEPPVKLKNPKPVKPFEFFMNLVSTPKYDEIDPTLVLFITFPLFFGFMVGDLGFGLGLVVLGAIIRSKFGSSPEAARLGLIIVAGGIMASVFGLVVFAEAFGIPFHAPESNPDEHAWSDLASIPIHPMLEKMHDIKEMLAISFVAGWLHLSLGFVFGFFNHIRHSKKHALAKVAWFLLLLGLFQEIMVVVGDATLTSQFVNSTIFSFMPDAAFGFSGIDISLSAVVLMVAGVAVLPVTEGPLVLTEVIGVFTNLVSYARLAALAIGKGGMAFAFNTMLLPTMLDGDNLLFAVPAGIGLVVAQLFFVFFLGSLSAGIQAIRLNYVEFFIKFFEGGGTDFTPLSYERKHSVAEG